MAFFFAAGNMAGRSAVLPDSVPLTPPHPSNVQIHVFISNKAGSQRDEFCSDALIRSLAGCQLRAQTVRHLLCVPSPPPPPPPPSWRQTSPPLPHPSVHRLPLPAVLFPPLLFRHTLIVYVSRCRCAHFFVIDLGRQGGQSFTSLFPCRCSPNGAFLRVTADAISAG